jgi:acetyl esterase/lipase
MRNWMNLGWLCGLACVLLLGVACGESPAAEPEIVQLWSGRPPGDTKELPAESDITKPEDNLVGGRPIIKLTNVSTPTLSIFRPAKELDTGAAVVICPGGGHHILAFDHEGTETAEWLNTLGVTGIVLKYRVPFRNPDKRWEAAVQDAQRAICLTRDRASAWGIDPARIGILGFSAGGETAGRAALMFNERQYPAVDAVDKVSCRPDFAILIYPAYLAAESEPRLRDNVVVTKETPPMFLAHAFDDPVTPLSSLLLAAELRKAGVPAELHLYATGGHGFGMRDTGEPINAWPQRCGEWLKRTGWLGKPESAAAN